MRHSQGALLLLSATAVVVAASSERRLLAANGHDNNNIIGVQQQQRQRYKKEQSRRQQSSTMPLWFPNWTGGMNNCLLACTTGNDSNGCHPRPSYISTPKQQTNLMKMTMKECCDSYYWWVDTCFSESSNDAVQGEASGSLKWYADYPSFKCVQRLIISTGTTTTTTTAAACCRDKFSYLALEVCVASSEGTDYEGSDKYYVDYVNGRCVQDCYTPPGGTSASPNAGICGGIITESSTKLYTNASTCCSSKLSYIDPLLCETRSESSSSYEGTFRLYPHVKSGTCVIDHNPANAIVCSIGYKCQLLHSTTWVSKLYQVSPNGVEECCSKGLPYVNPVYCKSRTMGVVSRKWFVDYGKKICHQDCKVDSKSPSCAINNDPAATYYDTPEQCCQSKLGYRNQAKCLADSTHVPYKGSNDYYVNYLESKCVQECPISNGGNCGGVVGDSSTVLYGAVGSCCEKSLGYMNRELCLDRSDSSAMGTGKYYPKKDGSICVMDTSVTPCISGKTCQRVNGWVANLYGTVAKCCESYTSSADVDVDYCNSFSTGIATGKWFRHEGNRCAKHCTAAADAAGCDIPVDPSSPHYNSARECCTSELAHLNVNTCAELSLTGGILADLVGTNEYYVDWIHQTCVKNCPEGNKNACGGLAVGRWVTLYSDVDACCGNIKYIPRNDCVKA